MYLWIQIEDVKIGGFYLPPEADNDEEYIKMLEEQLEAETRNKLVILGDLNSRDQTILHDKRSNKRGKMLFEVMDKHNLNHLEPIKGQ